MGNTLLKRGHLKSCMFQMWCFEWIQLVRPTRSGADADVNLDRSERRLCPKIEKSPEPSPGHSSYTTSGVPAPSHTLS